MLNLIYEKGSDYILIINEMWLQKAADFQSREYVGANEEELIAFIVVGVILNPRSFWGCSRMEGTKKAPLTKVCHTYPTMMKFGTLTFYLKKIQKIYKSHDTLFEFC